jgi:hypothetical protein
MSNDLQQEPVSTNTSQFELDAELEGHHSGEADLTEFLQEI